MMPIKTLYLTCEICALVSCHLCFSYGQYGHMMEVVSNITSTRNNMLVLFIVIIVWIQNDYVNAETTDSTQISQSKEQGLLYTPVIAKTYE